MPKDKLHVRIFDMINTATRLKNQETKQTKTSKEDASAKNLMKEALYANKSLFQLPKIGDLIEGTVIDKESGVLYIDLGPIGTGVIYGKQYFDVQDSIKNLKPGDKVAAKLIELENKNGYRELSMKEAGEEQTWKTLRDKKENQELIEIKITEVNRGGLMAKVGDIIGFIPVSQLAPAHYPRVEGGDKEKILEELRKFIGETFQVNILDIDPKEQKLILSEKSAENDSMKESLSKYKVGDIVEGEITGVVEFGAFIKFDPILEGLIHISELDWNLVRDPKDIVNIGDKLKAKIVDISSDGRISLSIKALQEDPWSEIEKKFKKGDTIDAEVTKINAYGALVKIEDGIQGLVHVSEFESEEQLKENIEEGKKYKFEIATLEGADHKITLKLIK